MRPTIDQTNAGTFLQGIGGIKDGVVDFTNGVKGFTDGTADAISAIGEFCKIIVNAVDWFTTIIKNPIIILTTIDKLSIVILITLILLKYFGFKDLEKWMWVIVIGQVIAMAFI